MPQRDNLRLGLAGTADLKIRGRDVYPDLAIHFEKMGYEIAENSDVDALININHNWTSLFEVTASGEIPNPLCFLLRVEPSSVYPIQYTSEIESAYDLIMDPGDTQSPEKAFLRWPYSYQQNPCLPAADSPSLNEVVERNFKVGAFDYEHWSKRPITISMIAANKISPNGTGNYSLRRQFANYECGDLLQVYGSLWTSPFYEKFRYRFAILKFAIQSKGEFSLFKIFSGLFEKFKNVIGPVTDKHSVILKSKFSIVIENSDTYVSEKLLDTLVGGSIPIYFGTDLVRTGIPEELVIRSTQGMPEILRIVNEMNAEEIEKRLDNILTFLRGEEFPLWEAEKVHKEICTIIDQKIKDKFGLS
jgi:hypothetical protein